MWRVEDFEAVPVELDFTASDQGRCKATAVTASGVRLINAIEFVDVEPEATQVEVCECCGFSSCAPGGWVVFRRMGEEVVWLPAWRKMEQGDWETGEYAPPSFLRAGGAPVFSRGCWERLRALHRGLPASHELPPLTAREAVLLCQGAAPGRVLGKYPQEPRLRRDLLSAVTEGDLAAEADAVDRFARIHHESVDPVVPVPEGVAVVPIEFWLDLPGTPGWKGFGRAGDEACLLFESSIALKRTGR